MSSLIKRGGKRVKHAGDSDTRAISLTPTSHRPDLTYLSAHVLPTRIEPVSIASYESTDRIGVNERRRDRVTDTTFDEPRAIDDTARGE